VSGTRRKNPAIDFLIDTKFAGSIILLSAVVCGTAGDSRAAYFKCSVSAMTSLQRTWQRIMDRTTHTEKIALFQLMAGNLDEIDARTGRLTDATVDTRPILNQAYFLLLGL